MKSKRPSSGIVIGAFRSILLLSILMKNKQSSLLLILSIAYSAMTPES